MTPADQLAHFADGTNLPMPGNWYSHARVTQLVQAAKEAGAAEVRAQVEALAGKWEREAFHMSLIGGESPRPMDFSEGHYIGTMKSYRARATDLRAEMGGE